MKGIAHFISGLALATCFRPVVEAALGGSCLPVLGALAALLPDTLDFRFARLLERCEDEAMPDPRAPDPEAIARCVAAAMRRSYESGQPRRILLHTVPTGADRWRSYVVSFFESGGVAVRLGPVVDSGLQPWSEVPPEEREARVTVDFPLRLTYGTEVRVDAFLGPSLGFERRGDHLVVHFLPWHRRWSHSLVLAGLLGCAVGALWGRWAGIVFAGGYVLHILEDQLGHLGCNLFWPLTRRRTAGFGLLHSADPLPNLLLVCLSLAAILGNLGRFSAASRVPATVAGVVWAVVLVLLGWLAIRRRLARHRAEKRTEGRERCKGL